MLFGETGRQQFSVPIGRLAAQAQILAAIGSCIDVSLPLAVVGHIALAVDLMDGHIALAVDLMDGRIDTLLGIGGGSDAVIPESMWLHGWRQHQQSKA